LAGEGVGAPASSWAAIAGCGAGGRENALIRRPGLVVVHTVLSSIPLVGDERDRAGLALAKSHAPSLRGLNRFSRLREKVAGTAG